VLAADGCGMFTLLGGLLAADVETSRIITERLLPSFVGGEQGRQGANVELVAA